ncbi:methionine gamma-lyase [Qipengyuania sp. 6B39]|uniref:methionine gamma-lyase n=1 Tax=Qipengyuania proteolytica TaxID=2867239 RepID=UPI001C8915D8|nr:methionine gamma-lyase [Qipengyuania proteolytica]MBX7495640.1 methionine gamma-lyase [Qipengyuania proteolytica]
MKRTTLSGFSSRAIHHGYDPAENHGALTPPMHMASTFAFESAEQGGAIFAGEQPGYFYSRISNPTVDLLEQRIATLEGAVAGVATASGMGAITAVMWTLLQAGDEIVTDRTLYGCTFAFFRHGLAKFGVKVTHVDLTDPAALEAAMSDKVKVVYFETPANPNMRLVDIAAISEVAHRHGAQVVVDNTYATPALTRPIERGADVVVHSATKYLGGHGDLIGGLVAGNAQTMQRVRLEGLKDMTGAVMSPFTATLIMRGLKTLALRMERHSATALAVAEWLEAQPQVSAVHYPGLESFAQHDLARRQMALPGGMIAFDLAGGYDQGIRFMNRLQMIMRAVSLGDAETLVQHPASMTHSTYTPEERAAHGIGEGLLRLSIGLEDAEDIFADLEQALAASDLAIAA